MVETVRKRDVWEVFTEIETAKTRKKKLETLKKYENEMHVRDVLQGTFDDRIQWNLPLGTPPYTPGSDDAPPQASLMKLHMRFKYFIKGLRACEELPAIKRERMFIDILETVHPKDAQILVSMVNKTKPEFDGLTKKLVQEALPDLIP